MSGVEIMAILLKKENIYSFFKNFYKNNYKIFGDIKVGLQNFYQLCVKIMNVKEMFNFVSCQE